MKHVLTIDITGGIGTIEGAPAEVCAGDHILIRVIDRPPETYPDFPAGLEQDDQGRFVLLNDEREIAVVNTAMPLRVAARQLCDLILPPQRKRDILHNPYEEVQAALTITDPLVEEWTEMDLDAVSAAAVHLDALLALNEGLE
jgi:hypothetical protein